MKKIIIAFICIIAIQKAEAQSDSIPNYQKYPVVPVFTMMAAPDSVKFTKDNLEKKKATVIMLFSPDCEHCQVATKDLLKHIDLFNKAQIIMISSLNFEHIKKFYEDYKIADYPNIKIGRDGAFFLGTFYGIKSYPSIFVYDKKGKFVKAFDATNAKMEDVAAAL